MADLHFSCTSCGRCCHDLRLTLSVEEAYDWASRGGLIQILCHAAPEIDDGSAMAAYKRARRITARSGDVAIGVQVILVARFKGACPNLGADLRCGIYAERPNVCRIYPAEVIPGFELKSANKLCPPEAWSSLQPIFRSDDGRIIDEATDRAIRDARAASLGDVAAKKWLVSLLGIDVTALENEGFAVWAPGPAQLVEALDAVRLDEDRHEQNCEIVDWRFVSPREGTATLIASTGARVINMSSNAAFDYLALY